MYSYSFEVHTNNPISKHTTKFAINNLIELLNYYDNQHRLLIGMEFFKQMKEMRNRYNSYFNAAQMKAAGLKRIS